MEKELELLKKEIKELKQELEEVRKELVNITKLTTTTTDGENSKEKKNTGIYYKGAPNIVVNTLDEYFLSE